MIQFIILLIINRFQSRTRFARNIISAFIFGTIEIFQTLIFYQPRPKIIFRKYEFIIFFINYSLKLIKNQ